MRVESAAGPVPKKTTSSPRSRSARAAARAARRRVPFSTSTLIRRRARTGYAWPATCRGRGTQQRQHAEQRERARRDQRGPEDATRLFQKLTVGSISGHRVAKVGDAPRRHLGSTRRESSGNRSASAARHSRSNSRPGLEIVRAVEHPPDHVPVGPAHRMVSHGVEHARDRPHPPPRRAPRWPGHAEATAAGRVRRPRSSVRRGRVTQRVVQPDRAEPPARSAAGHAHPRRPCRGERGHALRCAPCPLGRPSGPRGQLAAPGARHASRPSPRMMLSIRRVRPSRAASATTVSALDHVDRRERPRLRDGDVLDRHGGLGRERTPHRCLHRAARRSPAVKRGVRRARARR